MAQADGQEVLVVDGDEKVQRGLAQLLTENGLVPTVVSDAVRARELAREKYFAVALIDLDTPQTNAGLELTRWFKQSAPTTTTIVMCSRKTPSRTHICMQLVAAAPAPMQQTLSEASDFSWSSTAFRKAAAEMIAVPC